MAASLVARHQPTNHRFVRETFSNRWKPAQEAHSSSRLNKPAGAGLGTDGSGRDTATHPGTLTLGVRLQARPHLQRTEWRVVSGAMEAASRQSTKYGAKAPAGVGKQSGGRRFVVCPNSERCEIKVITVMWLDEL